MGCSTGRASHELMNKFETIEEIFMMKRVLFFAISMSLTPATQASQVSQVEISESAPTQAIRMVDQRFEPITQEQPYQATCSRQVLDHMEPVCNTVSDTVCRGTDREVCTTQTDQVCNSNGCTNIPRRVCRQERRVCEVVPRRVCSERAVMRTEFYSCTRYQTVVVGQRLVKTFEHNLEIAVDRPDLLQGQRLVISILAREASVAPTLVSSFPSNLLTVEIQKLADMDNGGLESHASRILVHVAASTASIGKILSSSVQNLQLSKGGVSMDLPGVAELSKDLNIGLTLGQNRFLIGDKVLFRGTIDSASLSLATQGDALKVMIPLGRLTNDMNAGKKHNLSVSISLKQAAHTVLNTNDMAAILGKRLEAKIKDVKPN